MGGHCKSHRRQELEGYVLRPLRCINEGRECLECDKPAWVRQLCMKHYSRHRRAGTLQAPPRVKDENPKEALIGGEVAARLERLSDPPNEQGCRLFRNSHSRKGYGTIRINQRNRAAHRVSMELHLGRPLHATEVVHHKCANKACITPGHLQLVTPAENTAEMLERMHYQKRIRQLESENADLRERIQALQSCTLAGA